MRAVIIGGTLAAILALGCGDDGDPNPDGGGGGPCSVDSECDDGQFCNGVETCDAEDVSADARGCVGGEAPCPVCDEDADECSSECPDADGDGQADAACGGIDCDDTDRDVFAGATEICDEAGIDEDCDPTTLGRDEDSDGYVSLLCCNAVGDANRCGEDCDDRAASANPDEAEICNGADDDCDGVLDEGVTTTYYRDMDGDLFGDVTMTAEGCAPPVGFTILEGDCDDASPLVSPGREESCMVLGEDDDCDGSIDETCDCESGTVIDCGPGAPFAGVGICRDGSQTCGAAGTFADCEGGVFPGAESCDGLDEDCDGTVDEGGGRDCPRNSSLSGTTACGRAGTRRCSNTCSFVDDQFYADGESVSSCDYCADTLTGFPAELALPLVEDNVSLSGATRQGEATGMTLNDGSSRVEVGIAWSVPITVGYGETRVETFVRTDRVAGGTSDSGWALLFVEDTPSLTTMVGPAEELGVPSGLRGWSAEWRHGLAFGDGPRLEVFVHPADVRVRGSITFAADFDTTSPPTTRTQGIRLLINPDDPTTPATDETRIRLFYRVTSVNDEFVSMGECRNEGTSSCGLTLRPGDVYRAAVSGATFDASSANRYGHFLPGGAGLTSIVTTTDACP